VRERANFGRLGSFSFLVIKKDIGIKWILDKKKMCGVKPHIGIGTMKKMWNLICGKFTAGRNYNLTRDMQRKEIPEIPIDAIREALLNSFCINWNFRYLLLMQ